MTAGARKEQAVQDPADPGEAMRSYRRRLDPELAGPQLVMEQLGLHATTMDELLAQRDSAVGQYNALLGPDAPDPSVSRRDFAVPRTDGAGHVRIRVYRLRNSTDALPGLFWIHGGGLVIGSIEADDRHCERYVQEVGCAVVSVEYRLAPEHRYPAAVEDCYSALVWVSRHASDVGLDADRLALGGSSAGGGLAAAVALMARDRKAPALTYQLLVRPMLDDRNDTPSSREFAAIPGWNRSMNGIGWSAYLGAAAGSDDVPAYAAAARATDLRGLPPTMIQVGELEIFRDEAVGYAVRLMRAGVPTELHVYPGAYHGWDGMAPDAGISRRSRSERYAALERALFR